MISIILSTYKPHLLKRVLTSIEETIGAEYEIIAIENSNKYSICEEFNFDKSNILKYSGWYNNKSAMLLSVYLSLSIGMLFFIKYIIS